MALLVKPVRMIVSNRLKTECLLAGDECYEAIPHALDRVGIDARRFVDGCLKFLWCHRSNFLIAS